MDVASINLAPLVVDYLKLVASDDCFTEDTLTAILKKCASSLVNSSVAPSISGGIDLKPVTLKGVFAALITLLVEASRINIPASTLSTILINEYNFPEKKSNCIVGTYENCRTKLQVSLQNICSPLPHITDVKWDLNYALKSSNTESSPSIQYQIHIDVESHTTNVEGKKLGKIEFTCNLHELQDLVCKLKEAVKHLEKISIK